MSLVVAAPVFDREWALPTWYEALSKQTVQPDEALFIHGGEKGDGTWNIIGELAENYGLTTHRLHVEGPNHERADSGRFQTLTDLRNQMLATASVTTQHDYLLSLDTDVMLEDPTTIEQLVEAAELGAYLNVDNYVTGGPRYDVVSCLTYLHPHHEWTCNAGLLGNPKHHPREAIEWGRPGDLGTWPWNRCSIEEPYAESGIQPIDIPMAIVLMPARVYRNVRYRWHESGEDIGFAINLKLADLTAGWIPSVQARHVWDRYSL